MVRSIFLRGFDQDMANRIGDSWARQELSLSIRLHHQKWKDQIQMDQSLSRIIKMEERSQIHSILFCLQSVDMPSLLTYVWTRQELFVRKTESSKLMKRSKLMSKTFMQLVMFSMDS